MEKYIPPIRTGLLDFFRTTIGSQFVIPVYQRNYTWTANKEVKQYLEDMFATLKGDYKNHFLGIIIYLETPITFSEREFSVIDGQQRLTTTFLALYAIREILVKQNKIGEIEALDQQFLTNPSQKIKYKLKPLVSDDEVYQCIVEERFDDIKNLDSNVYKNYVYIRNYVSDLLQCGYTLDDILTAMNKLYCVCVPISEEDNAQKIFESINATGVKLTASDLIRNYVLMDLPSDTQEKYYAKYWKKIEDSISGDSKKLELFFRIFLAIKNLTLPNRNEVYRLFVKWLSTSEKDRKEIFEEILRYAEAYNAIYIREINELDSSIRDAVKEYRRMLSEMPAPLVMEFFIMCKDGKISEESLSSIIELINNYLIRRGLCSFDTSAITKLFPNLLKNVLKDCDGNYSNIVEVVKKDLVVKNAGNTMNMPDDQQLKELVRNANMYNVRATLRIVFDRMEHENNPAPVDLSKLSVEHLMPQTPTREWLSVIGVDDDTYQKNVHRLGNLTLAARSDNSTMGNKPWEYKNAVLKSTSHLKMNEELLKYEDWNLEKIDKRTEELLDRIIELYPYPEVSLEIIPREEIFINNGNIAARGFLSLDDGSVEIDVGTTIVTKEVDDKDSDIFELRQSLLEDGIIAEQDGVLQFVRPYTFYSKFSNSTALSPAASLIMYGSRSGWNTWTDKAGKSLSENEQLRNKFSYMNSEDNEG